MLRLRTVCSGTVGAPCGVLIHDGPLGHDGGVSHGLCQQCAAVFQAQAAEYRAQRAAAGQARSAA